MDKRIIKTKNSISNALLKLIEEKSATKITVSEIAKLANIERKTFYLHYSCIDDVYLDIAKSLSNQVETEAEQYISNPGYSITDIFTTLNIVINNNLSFFKAISKNDSYSFLLHSFEDSVSKVTSKIAIELYNIKSPNLKFYTDFYATGIVKLYRTWLRGDTNLTQEQLTNIVSRACFLSVEELTKNRK